MDDWHFDRRAVLKALGVGITSLSWFPGALAAADNALITKPIPKSGERLPVIGMGTWRSFNVGRDPKLRKARTRVLKTFFASGGRLIDSSPMYGSSQAVVGHALEQLGMPKQLFSADKVWTGDAAATREQLAASATKWNLDSFDLMQVHNLVAWEAHLQTLQKMKAAGQLRYVGVTTSHGRRHEELEHVMKTQALDFVQLTYNIVERRVEQRLLPLAAERGIAVIVNRPFRGGSLVDRLQSKHPLPKWAKDVGCSNWPEFLLQFIVSHSAVTCAIPATTKVVHMRENMGAAHGRLPNDETRKRMLAYFQSL